MRLHDPRFLLVAAALVLCVGLPGCSDSEDVTQPSASDTQADVTAGATAGTTAGPQGEAAADMIVGMMNVLEPAPAPMVTGDVAAAFVPPACPETFDLPSGISGSCSVGDGDVVTFVFGGSISVNGASVTVEGTLVATPAVEQPETGSRYALDFDATASSDLGTATWSATGTLVVDETGEVLDFSLTMTHTLTPTGGPTSTVTVIVGPDFLEMLVTGPRGNVVRFVMDRNAMSGVVTINGFQVALVTFSEGCAFVDFLDPELEDQTICPGA